MHVDSPSRCLERSPRSQMGTVDCKGAIQYVTTECSFYPSNNTAHNMMMKFVKLECVEVVRHVVVNDMSCWTIVGLLLNTSMVL